MSVYVLEKPFLLTPKAARINSGLSLKDAAKALHILPKTLERIEETGVWGSVDGFTPCHMCDVYGLPEGIVIKI